MDGSPDPLVVILGTVAFALVTIGGIFVATLLWARHTQRQMPSSAEVAEVLKAAREREPGLSRSYLWQTLFGLLMIALLIAGMALAVKGQPVLFGVVTVLFLPAAFIFSGLMIIRSQFVVVYRPFRPPRLLTGEGAVRRGRGLIAMGLGMLVLCLALALLTHAGTWLGRCLVMP